LFLKSRPAVESTKRACPPVIISSRNLARGELKWEERPATSILRGWLPQSLSALAEMLFIT